MAISPRSAQSFHGSPDDRQERCAGGRWRGPGVGNRDRGQSWRIGHRHGRVHSSAHTLNEESKRLAAEVEHFLKTVRAT